MRSRTFIIIALAGLIGVSCGSDDESGADATAAVTVDAASPDTADAEPVDTDPAGTPEVTERGGIYGEPLATGAATTDTTSTDAGADSASTNDGTAMTGVATTDVGDALVDSGGFVLYGFTPDEGGTPTCEGACADAWPPVLTDSADLPAGLDAEVFGVVERPDGSFQLAAGGWPLYRFAGDIAPGDTTGQGSGGVWFAAAPDGTLIM